MRPSGKAEIAWIQIPGSCLSEPTSMALPLSSAIVGGDHGPQRSVVFTFHRYTMAISARMTRFLVAAYILATARALPRPRRQSHRAC